MLTSVSGQQEFAVASIPTARNVAASRAQARRDALSLLVLWCLVVSIQFAVGSYQAERGNYSDEAAHFLNGLLVRDYLASGLGNPWEFAESYYLSYPKIAPMMWPPLFHVALGLFLLPGWTPQVASLLLVAATGAWTAWRLLRITQMATTRTLGVVAAGVFVTTSLVVNTTSAVMLDVVVAALTIEATYWLARFVGSQDTRHALGFGMFAACCCLTKGNGLSIIFVPVILIVLTNQYQLLKHKGLWYAAAMVVVFALPFVFISFRIDSSMGGYSPITLAQGIERTQFYSTLFWNQLGASIVLLALAGMAAKGHWYRLRERVDQDAAMPAMTALVIAGFLFHIFNPVEVYDERYIVLVVAPFLALCCAGLVAISQICARRRQAAVQLMILCVLLANFLIVKPAPGYREPLGYREAATALHESFGLAGRRVLIVSNETGEGAFVSEVAVWSLSPRPTILRGSKLIAFDDWDGRDFHMKFSTSATLTQELEDLHVDFVILDKSVAMPYSPLVREMLTSPAGRFEHVREIERGRQLAIYRVRHASPGPAKKPEAEVAALRRVLRAR